MDIQQVHGLFSMYENVVDHVLKHYNLYLTVEKVQWKSSDQQKCRFRWSRCKRKPYM